MVDGARSLHLFGGHVVQRTYDLTRAGQRERFFELRVFSIRAQQFCQAKIGDLHASALVDENVLRLDVAVNDACVVRELQGVADLRDNRQRFGRRQSAGRERLPQVGPVDVFHDEIIQPVNFTKLVDGDD